MPQKSAVSVSLLPAHALKLQIIAPIANCHALFWTQFLLADGSYCYSRVLCEFLQAPELFTSTGHSKSHSQCRHWAISTSIILKLNHTGWFKIILSTGQFTVHFLRVSELQHWPYLLTPHGDTADMHQWSFVCNLIDIKAPHLSWNCNLLTLHPETSSLHRSRSIIQVCKPLRKWLNIEGPSSLNRALEHTLQHLLLCMHRSSGLAAVARILGFKLGFVGRL